MTSNSEYRGKIDISSDGKHRLVIVSHLTTFQQNRKRTCKFLIDLTWNAPFHKCCGNVVSLFPVSSKTTDSR